MKNKTILIILAIFLVSSISAVQVCEIYDDFSSGVLDIDKWEIRQDVEGQPFTEEYGIIEENGNFVFHTKQNTIGDRRVYLYPKHTFTTGDILEYDFNVVSKEGNYMQMNLLTGDQYIRVGIMGYVNGVQGFDELGISHIKMEFQENNLHLERTSPSGIVLVDNLALTKNSGKYELYVGAGSGHNGKMHIDFDNFKLCTEQEEPNELEQRVADLEARLEEMENRTSWIEGMIDKIVAFIRNLPHGFSKNWRD